MRGIVVADNWKMDGSRASVAELVQGLLQGLAHSRLDQSRSCEVLICPPLRELQPQPAYSASSTTVERPARDTSSAAHSTV